MVTHGNVFDNTYFFWIKISSLFLHTLLHGAKRLKGIIKGNNRVLICAGVGLILHTRVLVIGTGMDG